MRLAHFITIAGLWLGSIGCDHGLDAAPSGPTGIAGRLTFVGAWPDEVEEVAVAVYQEVPQTLPDFFDLTGADTEVRLGEQSYDFFVSVEADGVYRWVVVAWREKESFWDFSSLLGCYYVAGDTLPTPVVVRRGEVTRNIDITVDFGVLKGETGSDYSVCERALPAELLAARDSGE